MRRIFRLATFFFLAVAVGCASAVPKPSARGIALGAEDAAGVWTLADDENAAFDVRLSPKGTAVSNWSKGNASARGERGRWAIVDGRIVIDYDDGWRDIVFRNEAGAFRKMSYAPGMAHDGPSRGESTALRTPKAVSDWVGVYQVPVAESRMGREFFVSIQSTHLAWKSIDDVRVGSWWISGDALRIRWANGWLDELRYIGPGYQVRSWRPATVFDAAGNPAEPPTNTGGARRAE